MFKSLRNLFSKDKIEAIEKKIIKASEAGDKDGAWKQLQPLLRGQSPYRILACRTLYVRIPNLFALGEDCGHTMPPRM
jgi:hypothetical protein